MRPKDEYAGLAPLYDPCTTPFLGALRREVAARVARLNRGPVLDVCCGTGAQMRALAELGLAPAGVDLSPAMLLRAARRAPGRVVLADAARLPLGSGSVGVCVLTLALHEKPRKTAQAIFAEMARVVGAAGTLFVADYAPPRGRVRAAAASLVVAAVERLAGKAHFANYRDFMARGGLEGFLSTQGRVRYSLCERRFGPIALAVVRPA